MSDSKVNRKDFLKTVGLGLGAMAVGMPSAFAGYSDDESLSQEEKSFLSEYESWLKEFQGFVNKRNEDTLDIDNNMRLMELSKEAEQRKPQMEKYMEDRKFADYFNKITTDITQAIVG